MPDLVSPALLAGALAGLAQPTLADDGLIARPWQAGDAPAVAAAYGDPAIQRWHARCMTSTEAAQWIASWPGRWHAETGGGWAITDGDTLLGQVALRSLHLPAGLGELSYWVVPAARGRGVAATAVRLVCGWAFARLGLHRIELAHSTANAASCRVAAKTGFALEGTKRREALHADGWHDMHLHARLADD